MISEKFRKIKEEALHFDSSMGLFILAVMLCSFSICSEYSILRPTSNAIFLSNFSSKAYPYAWLGAVPLNFIIVYLYNRILPHLGCLKTMLASVLTVMSVNTLCGLFVSSYPFLSFFHYMFKDIYVLLMFKQLWSLIHMTIDTSRAKYLYGILFGVGGLGSVLGGLVPGFLATQMGSYSLFFFSPIIYLALFCAYAFALKQSHLKASFKESFKKDPNLIKTLFQMIFRKKYITYILLIVVFMQMIVALTDYQFNTFLEKNITELDLRTQYNGRLISIINTVKTLFQFLGGFLLIHFLGLRASHQLVPLFLCTNAFLFLLFPSFPLISYCFVSIKSTDYSFFGIIREMLYIPLNPEEKFRAKAVIDIFAYRSAKALASFILLGLQWFAPIHSIQWITGICIILFLIWSFIIQKMFRTKMALIEN